MNQYYKLWDETSICTLANTCYFSDRVLVPSAEKFLYIFFCLVNDIIYMQDLCLINCHIEPIVITYIAYVRYVEGGGLKNYIFNHRMQPCLFVINKKKKEKNLTVKISIWILHIVIHSFYFNLNTIIHWYIEIIMIKYVIYLTNWKHMRKREREKNKTYTGSTLTR